MCHTGSSSLKSSHHFTNSFDGTDDMNATAKISHWTLVLALAGACFGASAQTASEDSLVWVENESFEFTACTTAAAAPSDEQNAATVSALRARAGADLNEVLRASGVQLGSRQFLLITPLDGNAACNGHDSQMTFRATAVDQRSSMHWVTDITVGGASTDRSTLARLAGDLARQFGGVSMAKASLK